ncbi:trypsin-like peptidase domain-containing protein [Anaerobacillus sp. CMMVII]|uniref:S1 family peptidase n=1 Tax=Anaerobacillus sp. CMMVII TaxID=2755588 RepID=UPI0021B71EA3|nr:serine protease [Anaerobacillus sp. CMMVII]MCT8138476.1 trypsin-like peptidase domain-containing protein [Anaerobacillus sp. CMMVII]
MRIKHLILFLLIVFFIMSIFFFHPLINNKLFFNKAMYSGLIEKIEKEAISANIKIVRLENIDDENGRSISISPGASGVIIGKEGNRYFALTANHVISEIDNIDDTQFVVMGYDDLDYVDYLSKGGQFQGGAKYYQQFPVVLIEHVNDEYDLAIISFITDDHYNVLPVADENPKYGDIVASMSNPYGKRNVVTIGKISSKKLRTFGDEIGKRQHPMLEHTALVSEGSSGSALINENLEIVGIHIGGNYNLFRHFISGMAMPNEQIRTFLEEWKK